MVRAESLVIVTNPNTLARMGQMPPGTKVRSLQLDLIAREG